MEELHFKYCLFASYNCEQIKSRATLVINLKNYYINKDTKDRIVKIFEWYKKDFAVTIFLMIDFINLFRKK
jgi:hypothetical protein